MVDKEGLLKEIIDDITTLYDEHYEEELCLYYEKFMPCPYYIKCKYGCENHEKCDLYLRDLIETLFKD